MEPITSSQNPLIKNIKRLSRRKQREKERKFLIEGARIVAEAVLSGWPLELVLTAPGFSGPDRDKLLGLLKSKGIRTVEIGSGLFNELAETESPQGIIALAPMPGWKLEGIPVGDKPVSPVIVVIDGVQDPGNLGTIIRSADAFGADAVLLTRGTVDPYNPKTLRSTMGSIFHLPVLHNLETGDVALFLDKKELTLVVGDPGAEFALSGVDLTTPVALLLGSEARGPSGEYTVRRRINVSIPMPGRAESLNVGVAASIMLYEISRQRGGR